MRQIMPAVYLIEGLRIANVYVLVADTGLTVIDTGYPGAADQIATELEKSGYALSDVQTIILTHCHSDHIGAAAELARRSGAQVAAHQDEVPYIEGTQPLLTSSWLQRVLDWMLSLVFKIEPCKVDRKLQAGDVVEVLGGLQVIHTPGHTPGNIALYQPERQILFCGDTVFNQFPLQRRARLQLPPRIVSVDPLLAERSARKLTELLLESLCAGHGEPILEHAGEKLREAIG